jgi:N6-adenosine-specific RNA methylase IME4
MGMDTLMDQLPREHFGAILADPPWHYKVWAEGSQDSRLASSKYRVMATKDIVELPVVELAAPDCVLFIWATWPMLTDALAIIDAWGFKYKTCAFDWTKAHVGQIEMFRDDADGQMGMGYWTRANTEPCLLATRGKPKRLNADVRQAIIAPRREHSRKPDGVHKRIERLVAGPYLELFARQQRAGWTVWGNETNKFNPIEDIRESVSEGFKAIRKRKAAGGPGWKGHE